MLLRLILIRKNKMINKNIIVLSISIIIVLFFVGCNNINKKESDIKYDKVYTDKKLNPISKEYVIKILKAEYGDNISITTEDIKSIEDEYVVEVYVELKDNEVTEEHIHKQSLGEHRINMYTGEIIQSK